MKQRAKAVRYSLAAAATGLFLGLWGLISQQGPTTATEAEVAALTAAGDSTNTALQPDATLKTAPQSSGTLQQSQSQTAPQPRVHTRSRAS